MKSTFVFLFGVSLILLITLSSSRGDQHFVVFVSPQPLDSLVIDSTMMEDILDIVLAVNGEGMPKPPTEFRKGHANPTNTDPVYTQTDYGYSIQMPSHNGVPTPTVHNGKLFVSGGFGSKQFFCLDAQAGTKVWGVDLDDDGPSAAVVDDGVVLFNTESCTLFACDEKTGEHLWSWFLGDPLMSTPTVANGLVFTAFPAHANWGGVQDFGKITEGKFNPSHVLIAMDVKTGDIKWEKWIDGDIISAPVANDGKLHLVSFPGTYFVVDQQSGQFEKANKMRGTSALTFGDKGMIISRRSDEFSANGEIAESIITYDGEGWKHNYRREGAAYLDGEVQSQSLLKTAAAEDDAGNGFAGGAPASAGANYAMMNIGQSNVSTLQAYSGSRTLNSQGRNFNTMGDSLVCTDEVSGGRRWAMALPGDLKQVGGFLGSPPIQVGNDILVATYVGDILVINAETGKVRKKYSTGANLRTQPVAMHGWIYVGTSDGRVLAINTGESSITGWPMLGKNAGHTNG